MSDRISRIFALIALTALLFFPVFVSASVEDDIRSFLEQSGFTVREMSDLPVLTPDSDMTFDIRNKRSIRNGKTELYIDLFYNSELYSTVTMTFVLEGGPSLSENMSGSMDRSAKRISTYSLVKKGSKVDVVLKNGNLTIRTEGLVLNDGNRSDEVEVLLVKSNRKVKGSVRDRKTVLVNEEGANP